MTFAVLLQQQQQVTASPLPHSTVALASSAATLPQALPTAVARAAVNGGNSNDRNVLRLRKRHSNWHERYAREMNSQEMEWANPCGGEWLHNLTEQPVPPPRMSVKRHLRMLQSSVGKEQKTIKALTPAINISDMKMWSLHKDTYKFLPVLKKKPNVALRRWHRQMQLYVASFAYLRRAQIQWDHKKLQRESEISKELHKLKQSARYILCEIETAINKTLAQGGIQGGSGSNASHVKKSHQLRLHFLSRDAIEKRLKFQTHIRFLYAPVDSIERQRHQQKSGELQEVNPIDLKFLKFRYFGYLRGILKNLRQHTRRSSELIMESGSASSAASGSKQEDASLLSHSEQEESRAIDTNSLEQALNRTANNASDSRRKKPMRRRKNKKEGNDGNASRNASRRRQNKQQQEEVVGEQLKA